MENFSIDLETDLAPSKLLSELILCKSHYNTPLCVYGVT